MAKISDNVKKASETLAREIGKQSKSQARLQGALIALTLVIAISTVIYTWITWKSVRVMEE